MVRGRPPARGAHRARRAGQVQDQEQTALPAGHGEPGEGDGQQRHHGGRHHRDVQGHGRRRDRQAAVDEDCRHPEHQPGVQQAAAHDVADGEIPLSPADRDDGRGQFGQGRPEGDHREPDDEAADAQGRGDVDRPLDEDRGPGHQQPHPHHDQDDRDTGRGLPGRWPVDTGCGGRPVRRRARRPGGGGGVPAADQHRPVRAADPAVQGHERNAMPSTMRPASWTVMGAGPEPPLGRTEAVRGIRHGTGAARMRTGSVRHGEDTGPVTGRCAGGVPTRREPP